MTRTIFPLCMCVVLVCSLSFTGPARGAERQSTRGINGAIEKTVKEFRFYGTFGQCLDKLGTLANVRIVGDWTVLTTVGVSKDKRISFKADGARLSQLLDVAIARATPREMHLGWFIDDGIGGIRVTTQRAALARRRSARAGTGAPARQLRPLTAGTVTFSETPLSTVVQTLRELTKLNIHVNWRALAEINVDRDTPVTVNTGGVSISRLLDLVTDELSTNLDKFQRVYWINDGGVVKISTGTALNTGLRTQVLDVGGLLMPAVEVKMPRRIGLSGLRNSNTNDRRSDRGNDRRSGGRRDRDVAVGGAGLGLIGGQGDSGKDRQREKAEKLKEGVIGVIKDSIGQDMWEPSGKGSIRIIGNRLVISQTLLGYKLMNRSMRTRRR